MPAPTQAPLTREIITPGYDPERAEHRRADLEKRFPDAGRYIDKFLKFTGALITPEFEPVEFQPWMFAVVKVSGRIAEDGNEAELDKFAETVATLDDVGLPITFIHGAGKQITERLKARGVVSKYNLDGTRITPPEDMWAVKAALHEVGDRIQDAIAEKGSIVERPREVFTVELSDPNDRGSAKPDRVHIRREAIVKALRRGKPVMLDCLAQVRDEEYGEANVNADIIWSATTLELEPWKGIVLTRQPGIIDKVTGKTISELATQEALCSIDSGKITDGAVTKMRAALEARSRIPDHNDVVITCVDNKLDEKDDKNWLDIELYTAKGGGTDIHN